jgi:glycosyltransferase involved in cell wall biosynthesis
MRVALVYPGRRSLYSYCAAKALADRCELMGLISRQVENIADWRALPFRVLHETDTFSNAREFVRRRGCLADVFHAARRVKEFRPDVVYVPMISPLTPAICAQVRGIPKVVTVHDPAPHSGDRSPVKALLHAILLRQAARVVVLSSAFVPLMRGRLGNASRVDVIPHGNFGYYAAKSANCPAPADRAPTILFFGRIEPYKGIEVLLKAFAHVKAAVPRARLRIVGGGFLSVVERSEVTRLGVELTNRWIADREVGGYFSEADAIVLPYTDASQSGVLAIAASFGVPAIASNVGGLAEQVMDGVNGLLTPPGDSKALAEACIAVLVNDELRSHLSAGAKAAAEIEMDWGRIGNMLIWTCQRAAREHRRGSFI